MTVEALPTEMELCLVATTPFQERIEAHIRDVNEKIELGILPQDALTRPLIVNGFEDYTYCLSSLLQTDIRLEGRLE